MDELNVPSFIQQPTIVPIEEKRVGFGRRLGAALLDGLIVTIVGIILFFTVGEMATKIGEDAMNAKLSEQGVDLESMPGGMGSFMSKIGAFTALASVAGIALSLIELLTGASPGKMLLAIQVAHSDGRKGDLSIWAIRWALKESSQILSAVSFFLMITPLSMVANIVGFVYFIGCLFVFGQKKMALHDIIAKTAVFKNQDVVY